MKVGCGPQLAQQLIGGLAFAFGVAVAVVKGDPDFHSSELAAALFLVAGPPDGDLVAVAMEVVEQERRFENIPHDHDGGLVEAAHQ